MLTDRIRGGREERVGEKRGWERNAYEDHFGNTSRAPRTNPLACMSCVCAVLVLGGVCILRNTSQRGERKGVGERKDAEA